MFCGPGGLRSRLAKAAGAEPSGEIRCGAKHISKSKCYEHHRIGPLLDAEMPKKCTVLWHKAHFQVNMYKAHQLRNTFGTTSARRRGVKQISKSKYTKHNIFRALFEVRMSLPFCQR